MSLSCIQLGLESSWHHPENSQVAAPPHQSRLSRERESDSTASTRCLTSTGAFLTADYHSGFAPLRWRCLPCSCVNFCSSFLSPPGPGRAELLSPGVHSLSCLRTSSLSSARTDSRPNPPFRHHFLPHVQGKEAGLCRQQPASWRFISARAELIRCISKNECCQASDSSACLCVPRLYHMVVLELAWHLWLREPYHF